MNFLVDAQLPPALCRWLNARGHDCHHVSDYGLTGASDSIIAQQAVTDGAILISKDEDFLVTRLPDRFPFIWVRLGNASNRALIAWLEPRWGAIETMLKNGERLIEVR